jgi:hypothetical protein
VLHKVFFLLLLLLLLLLVTSEFLFHYSCLFVESS